MFNSNFLRTILNVLTGGSLIWVFTDLLGCTTDNPATSIIEPTVCTASWLPPQYAALAGTAFVIVGFLMKMFGGYGATVGENLAKPVVPVVPAIEAKPGVVTATQVTSTK